MMKMKLMKENIFLVLIEKVKTTRESMKEEKHEGKEQDEEER